MSYGNHAGMTPFRECKNTGFDGGTRSACIMRYPGRIKAGTASTSAMCTIDILPTFAQLAGAQLPHNPIDGKNVWELIADKPGAVNPHDYHAFSTGKSFDAVMSGDGHWKPHVPHTYQTLVEAENDGKRGRDRQASIALSLFDMEKDPFETVNVIE